MLVFGQFQIKPIIINSKLIYFAFYMIKIKIKNKPWLKIGK